MGRYGVDYVSVRDAAEALSAAGEAVTVERVRAALGSGSFTTLGRHLRTWRRTQDPASVSDVALPELINNAAQTVWTNLSRAAEVRVAEAQAAAQAAVAAVQEEAAARVAQAKVELQKVGHDHQVASRFTTERLEEAHAKMADLEARLSSGDRERNDMALEKGRLEATAAQLMERLQGTQAQLRAMEEKHKQAQNRLQALECERISQAKNHQDHLQTAMAQLALERQQWQAREQLLDKQAAAHQRTIEHLQRQQEAAHLVIQHLAEIQAEHKQSALAWEQFQKSQQQLVSSIVPQLQDHQYTAIELMHNSVAQRDASMQKVYVETLTNELTTIREEIIAAFIEQLCIHDTSKGKKKG